MKIALGTVQWGLDYGIANTNGIPSNDELKEIIYLATQKGINLYDTAVHYGTAEKRLGELAPKESNIVTKVGSFTPSNPLEKQLEKSFNNLDRDDIYGCLFHDSEELLKDTRLWFKLLRYKTEGRVKKIGYSLYEPATMNRLLDKGLLPDIVQLPYSILDRKFEPYFEFLKQKGVEIHVRSVFLQGLYFKSMEELDSIYDDLKQSLKAIQLLRKRKNLSVLELALCYTIQNKFIDYAVLGVETAQQFEQIIKASKQKLSQKTIEEIKLIQLENKAMLNPVNWK